MVNWIIHGALLAVATFLSFKFIPDLKTKKNMRTALVAFVLAVLNTLAWWAFREHLPSILGLGLILWIVDVILLFLAGKFVPDFLGDKGTAPLAGAVALVFFGGLFVSLLFG